MDWFLYDNGLRHERVKSVEKANALYHVTNKQIQSCQLISQQDFE